MNVKRMAIFAAMVIMITAIVAMPAALAASNATLRIYGEDGLSAAFPYTHPEAPFDPQNNEAPEKDFVVFNPAYIPFPGIIASNVDSKEKVFARQWFVPELVEPVGDVWLGDPNDYVSEDVVTEYTYIFIDKHDNPTYGTALSPSGSYWTKFWMPVADNDDNQIGIDGCDINGDGADDWIVLRDVGFYPGLSDPVDNRKDINISSETFGLIEGENLTFLDHKVVVKNVAKDVDLVVDIYYTGNDDPECIGHNIVVPKTPGSYVRAGRHTVNEGAPIFAEPWYLFIEDTIGDTAYVQVGRLLHTSETFFVDGAEYDVARIYGPTDTSLKYITIRNPVPEHNDVNLEDLSVIKECVQDGELIPLLPPFNRVHEMIDDINIPDNKSSICTAYFPDNIGSVDDGAEFGKDDHLMNKYDTVQDRRIKNVPALDIYFTHKDIEPRFNTNLLEILDEYAGGDLCCDPRDAIDDGVAWLADQQNANGSWGTSCMVGATGLAVLKLETHAKDLGMSPFDPAYEYSDEVQAGLDYIFSQATILNISVQTAGNPDGDGDGQGVYFDVCRRNYETGIAAMAIAASGEPGRVVNVPVSAVDGWTYEDVLQDAVDYLAFAQTDDGPGRGGWRYLSCDNCSQDSDNSVTGYVVLGLAYAEAPLPGGFGLTIPDFVRNELDIWIDYIQNDVGVGPVTDDGGSGYTDPDNWVNILKTGNLLFEMEFVGDTKDTPRVQDAVDYLVRHWNDADDDPGWRGSAGGEPSIMAMYCVMKGLESLGIKEIDGIDWWCDDFCPVLLDEQNADGSWDACIYCDDILATEHALLTLQRAVPEPPIIEGWKWLDIHTMPDFYKEFVYPELPDIDGGTGDFLLVSSWRAPNSCDARVMFAYDQETGEQDIYVNDCKNYSALRLYGENESFDAEFPYKHPEAPFDPQSDEAPGKDFVTFNPAVMRMGGIVVDNVDSKMKVFARQWFIPYYKEPVGDVWLGDPNIYDSEDVITEYTYMLIDKHYMPTYGTALSPSGSYWTKFWMPVADNDDAQIGIDGCDINGDGVDDWIVLRDVGFYPGLNGTVDSRKDINISSETFGLIEGENLTFLDHKVVVKNVAKTVELVVDVYYVGNDDPECIGQNIVVPKTPGSYVRAGRHTVDEGAPIFAEPWYIYIEDTVSGTAYVQVGRLLHTSETFFVDGAEYDVAMIYGPTDTSLKYITIRNPVPEHNDVNLEDLSVIKECVQDGELMPLLPPFNRVHEMVDDINIPDDESSICTAYFPDNIGSVDDGATFGEDDHLMNEYDTVQERIISDIPALDIYFTHKDIEPRFNTSLLEILNESEVESWKWLDIHTMPDFYKEFVYPELPDIDGGEGDWLVTSSFTANNSCGKRVMFAYDAANGTGLYMNSVVSPPPPTACDYYDAPANGGDGDHVVDKNEAVNALFDYLGNAGPFGDGTFVKADAVDILFAYLGQGWCS